MQELISSVESRAEVVGRDLEEINGWFDCHRGEINCLKIREKDAKEEVEQLKGFIVGAGHEAQVFKNCLDRMEENVCKCGRTPSEVGEEFVSSEDEGRTELSYASAAGEEYVAPPVKNSIPLPVPALASCCLGPTTTLPPMEEISEEPAFICEDLEDIHLAPEWEQLTQLYSGEMREFLPSCLGDLDWSSGERSLVSGFPIHLRIGLSEEEGDAFLGALGVDRMEEAPVVKMEGDMEVVDAEFECRD